MYYELIDVTGMSSRTPGCDSDERITSFFMDFYRIKQDEFELQAGIWRCTQCTQYTCKCTCTDLSKIVTRFAKMFKSLFAPSHRFYA